LATVRDAAISVLVDRAGRARTAAVPAAALSNGPDGGPLDGDRGGCPGRCRTGRGWHSATSSGGRSAGVRCRAPYRFGIVRRVAEGTRQSEQRECNQEPFVASSTGGPGVGPLLVTGVVPRDRADADDRQTPARWSCPNGWNQSLTADGSVAAHSRALRRLFSTTVSGCRRAEGRRRRGGSATLLASAADRVCCCPSR
jgi:hypothetical protein